MQIRSAITLYAASLLALTTGYAVTNAAAEGIAHNLYVVQNDPSTGAGRVLQFAASGQTATLLATPMQTSLGAVTSDAAGNLYVSSLVTSEPAAYEVTEYAVSSTGATTALRTLTNMSTTATAMTVDAGGRLYTVNGSSINVYDSSATGSTAPARTITGVNTLLNAPTAIAVDAAGNLYVANAEAGNVLVFSATANGNVAPSRIIAGASAGIAQAWGVAVDASGDLFVTTSTGRSTWSGSATTMTAQILKFAPDAAGNVAPIQTLDVAAPNVASGIAVDASGNLYTNQTNASTLQQSVGVYSTKTAALAQTLASAEWTATKDAQIAVH